MFFSNEQEKQEIINFMARGTYNKPYLEIQGMINYLSNQPVAKEATQEDTKVVDVTEKSKTKKK